MKKMSATKLTVCALLLFNCFINTVFAQENINQQLNIKTTTSTIQLSITVQRGKVTIIPWDKNSIAVIGTLDELSEGLTLEQVDNHINIEDNLPARYNNTHSQGSTLTINIPNNINLHAKTVSADLAISDYEGTLTLNSVSGHIQASKIRLNAISHSQSHKVDNALVAESTENIDSSNINISSPMMNTSSDSHIPQKKTALIASLTEESPSLQLKTVSGKITTQALAGSMILKTVSGDIQDTNSTGSVSYQLINGNLNTDTQASHVEITQVSGNINANLAAANTITLKNISGNSEILLTNQTKQATLNSIGGNMTLVFEGVPNAKFNLNGGPSGKIVNQLTADVPPSQTRATLTFNAGQAQADIKLQTISGTLTLMPMP